MSDIQGLLDLRTSTSFVNIASLSKLIEIIRTHSERCFSGLDPRIAHAHLVAGTLRPPLTTRHPRTHL